MRCESSLLVHRLLLCSGKLLFSANGERLMHGPAVPGQRARLSEPIPADGTHEGLQVNVPLVVEDEAGALRVRLVAGGAVRVDEGALELRLAGVTALDRDRDLPEGAQRQDFEACVVRPGGGRYLGGYWRSPSALVGDTSDGLVHRPARLVCGSGHCLLCMTAVASQSDPDEVDATLASFLLRQLLDIEYGGLCWAVSVGRLRRRPCIPVHGLRCLLRHGQKLLDSARRILEVPIALDWVDKLLARKRPKEEGRLFSLFEGAGQLSSCVQPRLDLAQKLFKALDLSLEFAARFGDCQLVILLMVL